MEGEVLHYHVPCLNEFSTEDDLKKAYRKLALRSHPGENKHPQASAAFCMINEANQGLEDVLRHNDVIMRTQEREEIFNVKKNLGEKTNESENHKKNHKNERNDLKWTLV